MKKLFLMAFMIVILTGCLKDQGYEESQKQGKEMMQFDTSVATGVDNSESKPGCCRECITGTACGDDCISTKAKCTKPKGCACNK